MRLRVEAASMVAGICGNCQAAGMKAGYYYCYHCGFRFVPYWKHILRQVTVGSKSVARKVGK